MYIALGFIAFLLVVQVAIARLEKRMVWPYGTPEAQPQFPDVSGYRVRWVNDALQAGFAFLGWSPDVKGPRYQLCYGLLTSSERDCFVIIGAGKILNMEIRGTWIYSRTTNGSVFYTTDNQSCVEVDVSRRWRCQLAPVSTFSQLLERHRNVLRARGGIPQPFTAGREVELFRSVREEHYQEMARQGLIAFGGSSATHWRYTLWGALKFVVLNFSVGMLRAVTIGRIPRIA